jgi:hypothetical protein
MSNVHQLFKRDSIQNVLCEAADMGLTAIVLVGKKQNGGYWIRLSNQENAIETLGMVDLLHHELLTAVDENFE